MSNPFPPPLPLPDDERPADDGVPTREVDGQEVLDPDLDDRLVDSAKADRLAAEASDDDTEA